MDKINELTKKQKLEEKVLIANILDKMRFSKEKNKVQTYHFLDLSQQFEVNKILEIRKEDGYIFYGGYENADRKKIFIIPEGYDKNKVLDEVMCIIRVEIPKELYGTFEHKTYLGALMKLGLKREK